MLISVVFFLFLLGIFIGSFLNVLVDRLPREESIIKGRSHCESCGHTLFWYDLIPLFSFLQLQGKCRYCNVSLSLYYPLVELVTGVFFVLTFIFIPSESIMYYVLSIKGLISLSYYLFIVSSLIVIFFTDLKYGIIPDKVLYPAILITFSYILLNTNYMLQNYLLSAIGACMLFLLLFLGTRGRGMGFGDVKYAFFMGLLLGFPHIVVGLYIAFLTGAAISLILIVWGKKKLKGSTIPFGPFLVFGTLVSLFWGDWFLDRFFFSFLSP